MRHLAFNAVGRQAVSTVEDDRIALKLRTPWLCKSLGYPPSTVGSFTASIVLGIQRRQHFAVLRCVGMAGIHVAGDHLRYCSLFVAVEEAAHFYELAFADGIGTACLQVRAEDLKGMAVAFACKQERAFARKAIVKAFAFHKIDFFQQLQGQFAQNPNSRIGFDGEFAVGRSELIREPVCQGFADDTSGIAQKRFLKHRACRSHSLAFAWRSHGRIRTLSP